MKCDDPSTWPEPSTQYPCEDTGYGAVRVRAWANVHPKVRAHEGRGSRELLPIVVGSRFHRCGIEVTIGSSPEGGMMTILLSQSAYATVKRMLSRPSGMTLGCTGLRRHVGSELVERGALSGLPGGVRVE
jgi:hypothetical protein